MLAADAFRDQPTLTGARVTLAPLGPRYLADYLVLLRDPEGLRLTGSHSCADDDDPARLRQRVEDWLTSRPTRHDRADWAVLRATDGGFLGEVVLNEFDPANESVNFRIMLAKAGVNRGYGTEATRLAVDYALDVVGVHRVSLEVYEFNPRARRVYEKCGFRAEGVLRDALRWDGQWVDAVLMSVLATDERP